MRLFASSLSSFKEFALSSFNTLDKAGACWFSRTNNVSADGYTTIGTIANFGTGYKSGVLVIDESNDTWQGIPLEVSTNEEDDHNAAAILKHSSGYYISAYCHHANANAKWIKWRRSTNPNDPTSWGAEQIIITYGRSTYASLFESQNGDVHMMYRDIEAGGWVDFKSTDVGLTFDSGRFFCDIYAGASYPIMYQDPNNLNVIHIVQSEHPFFDFTGTGNGIYYGYYDFSTDLYYDGEGSSFALPIDLVGNGFQIYDETTAPTNECWVEDIILSAEGYPRVLFSRHLNNKSPNYGRIKHRFYAEKTASGWQTPIDLGQINDKFMDIGTIVMHNNFTDPPNYISNPEYYAQGRFNDNNPDQFYVGKQAGGTYDMSELFLYTRIGINTFTSKQLTFNSEFHQRLFMPLKDSKYSLMWINAYNYLDMKHFEQDLMIGTYE